MPLAATSAALALPDSRRARLVVSSPAMKPAADELSAALEAAIVRFGQLVRAIGGRHRLGDADLDEVLQEVRIRLWRTHRSAAEVEALTTSYVYRTAVSAALDILRRRRAFGAGRTAPLELVADPPDERRGPAKQLARHELASRIAAAVETIPASRRPVVRMHLHGYSREEIADLMGWSEAKTRNLLYRGLADLRERLTAAGISPSEGLDD